MAAVGAPRGRGALDPDGVGAARGAPGRARRGPADARVSSSASFHLKLAEDPKNATLLQEALYEITGRKLALAFELGEHTEEAEAAEEPLGEDEILELMKETFDARELNEGEEA